MRKTSIASIIERKREYNNKSMCACKSLYSKNGIYNYERGDDIININERKIESDNKIIDVCVRTYINYEIYKCERGATTIHPRRR